MAKIKLEESVSFGGTVQDAGSGQTLYSFTFYGWEFDTTTKTTSNFTYSQTVVDEREINTETYVISPDLFYSEYLQNGNIRHYTYNGNGNVTWADEIIPEDNACTLLISSVQVKKVSYFGGATGEVTINTTGAIGNLLFSLDNQNWQSSPKFLNLVVASYTAYVKDLRTPEPCRSQLQFTIDQETTPPVCDLLIQSVTVTGNSLRNSVTVTATTTNGPIAFTLLSGEAPSAPGEWKNLPAGTYTLVAIDKAFCQQQTTFTIDSAKPAALNFSRNPISQVLTGFNPGEEIELSLWVESEHYKGDYQKIVTRRKPALLNGKVNFELESILHTVLNRAQELPDLKTFANRVCRQGILNYYVVWGKVDPATNTAPAEFLSDVKTVIKGGIPPEQLYINDIFTAILAGKSLTWMPNEKKVRPEHPEFIYYLLQQESLSEVIVRRTFTLGNIQNVSDEVIPIPMGASMYRKVSVPAFRLPLGEVVSKVEVQLFDNAGTELTEPRIYKIDRRYARHQKYFLYENSLGSFETLYCSGPAEIGLDGKDEMATRTDELGRGRQYSYQLVPEKKIKQSTGLHSPLLHELLQEFVLSPERYEVRNEHLLPITLFRKSFTHDSDNRKPAGYIFEYDYAFSPTTYSRIT